MIDVDPKLLVRLGKYFKVLDTEEENTLNLQFYPDIFTREAAKEMLLLLFDLDPDELSWEEDHFRLWWD